MVKNADDPAYANCDVITLTNNATMHLFSNVNTNIQGKKLRVSLTMTKQQRYLGFWNSQMIFKKARVWNNFAIKTITQQHIFKIIQVSESDNNMSYKNKTQKEHFH